MDSLSNRVGTSNLDMLTKKFKINNRFSLPIDLSLSKSDELPVVCSHPESPVSDIFTTIAESVRAGWIRHL